MFIKNKYLSNNPEFVFKYSFILSISVIKMLWTNNFKAPIINIKVARQVFGITADWT